MVDDDQVSRYMRLYRGNSRSYGQFDPNGTKNKKMWTLHEEPTEAVFRAHLNGATGLGIVPIRDDGMCWWGAIDIDNHGKSEDLDLVAIESKVKLMGLPLITTRSKSGGVHLYLFGQEPLRADMLKTILTRWMADLKFDGSDCVFPKQTRLILDGEGNRQLGNWINLPYFNAYNTERYEVRDGKECPFDLFLTNAETCAISAEQLEGYFSAEHSEAPPCIRRAIQSGIGEGSRNEALFHITIYNRKRNPESAREMSHSMQHEIFETALPFSEADRTIRSAAKKSYGYLCKKSPWKDWCDKDTCRKAKYGISESEFETLLADTRLPQFSDLVKYINTEPVMWEFKMNGVPITMTTEEMMDYKQVRVRAMEKLHVVLPIRIRQNQWNDEILSELMTGVQIEEAPMDASPLGALQIRLLEFTRKADLTSSGEDVKDRESLNRGMPVVQIHRGDRVVMFRSIDFEDYLKRMRTDAPKNKTLWHRANREMGVIFDRVRVGGQVTSVWMVPIDVVQQDPRSAVNFDPEY